jgi:hypothetical protein
MTDRWHHNKLLCLCRHMYAKSHDSEAERLHCCFIPGSCSLSVDVCLADGALVAVALQPGGDALLMEGVQAGQVQQLLSRSIVRLADHTGATAAAAAAHGGGGEEH